MTGSYFFRSKYLAGLRPMPEDVQWLVTSVLGAPVGGI
jgi:hypothetical protein